MGGGGRSAAALLLIVLCVSSAVASMEWIDAVDEFEMDSFINGRILSTTSKKIGLAALRRGSTPCGIRGASYYNCKPGAQANPHNRECSRIATCDRAA